MAPAEPRTRHPFSTHHAINPGTQALSLAPRVDVIFQDPLCANSRVITCAGANSCHSVPGYQLTSQMVGSHKDHVMSPECRRGSVVRPVFSPPRPCVNVLHRSPIDTPQEPASLSAPRQLRQREVGPLAPRRSRLSTFLPAAGGNWLSVLTWIHSCVYVGVKVYRCRRRPAVWGLLLPTPWVLYKRRCRNLCAAPPFNFSLSPCLCAAHLRSPCLGELQVCYLEP